MSERKLTLDEFVEWAKKDLQHFAGVARLELADRESDLDDDGEFRAEIGDYWDWWTDTSPHDEREE